MTIDFATERAALGSEARHWRRACGALGDLEMGASASAWKELESYLGESVRKSLTGQAKRLTAQADRVLFALEAAQTMADLAKARSELLTLRRRYTRAEAMVDFYCEAVNTRTSPRIAAVLRGLDTLAVHSMDVVLRPLGIESPGAHIPRQGHGRLHSPGRRALVGCVVVACRRHQDHPAQPLATNIIGPRNRPSGRASDGLGARAGSGAPISARTAQFARGGRVAQLGQ